MPRAARILNAEKCVRVIYLCLASNARAQRAVCLVRERKLVSSMYLHEILLEFNQYKRIKSKNPTLL